MIAERTAVSGFIRWFSDISLADVRSVGGKNASLGELYRELQSAGVRVPNGFAITADGYRHFLRASGLEAEIAALLRGLQTTDLAALAACGLAIRQEITGAEMPADLRDAIVAAYERLGEGAAVDVAVRSSATAEDLPDASFAGQQETYLNVRGRAALLDACRRSFASLFTDRAISYRADKGFDQLQIALSIGVQRMVRSDLATSGVMFTLDTETGFRDVVLINASYGLGEPIVQGSVTPDEYYVFKPTLQTGIRADPAEDGRQQGVQARLRRGRQPRRQDGAGRGRRSRALRDDRRADPDAGPLGVRDRGPLQPRRAARPRRWTSNGRRTAAPASCSSCRPARKRCMRGSRCTRSSSIGCANAAAVLATGRSIGSKIAAGPVRVIPNAADLRLFQQGEVLVTDKTDPDWEPIMKKAAAIVTNRGGRTCHAAIVSRELGVPGDRRHRDRHRDASHDGQLVTVSCAEGDTGFVYEGARRFDVEHVDLVGASPAAPRRS